MLFLCVCVFLQGWVLFGFVVVLEALKGVMGLLGGGGVDVFICSSFLFVHQIK